jgi:hypothetical protein
MTLTPSQLANIGSSIEDTSDDLCDHIPEELCQCKTKTCRECEKDIAKQLYEKFGVWKNDDAKWVPNASNQVEAGRR